MSSVLVKERLCLNCVELKTLRALAYRADNGRTTLGSPGLPALSGKAVRHSADNRTFLPIASLCVAAHIHCSIYGCATYFHIPVLNAHRSFIVEEANKGSPENKELPSCPDGSFNEDVSCGLRYVSIGECVPLPRHSSVINSTLLSHGQTRIRH